jgi:hypothetical protein
VDVKTHWLALGSAFPSETLGNNGVRRECVSVFDPSAALRRLAVLPWLLVFLALGREPLGGISCAQQQQLSKEVLWRIMY